MNSVDSCESKEIEGTMIMAVAEPQNVQFEVEWKRAVLLWFLFFLISFGLGYPTLNRYDPRKLVGDPESYYRMVLQTEPANDFPYCSRILVPGVARPFYLLARNRVGTWDPVLFGLLVSNCLFSATAALLLLSIGFRVLHDLPVALLGCMLYLVNFVVPNYWLSGMVDSSEACALLAVTWALITRRWWLLPLIGIMGGLAKQSFVPFSTVFAFTWWCAEQEAARTYRRLLWVAGLAAASTTSMVLVYRAMTGSSMTPWAMAGWWWPANGSLARQLAHEFTDQNFWYAFCWLLPLGVWCLNRLHRPWVAASLTTAVVAVGIGAYADLGGTVNRPLFSVVGPVLSLSAALLLCDRRNSGIKSTVAQDIPSE